MKKVSFGFEDLLTSEELNARFGDLAGGSILSGFRLAPGTSTNLISLVRDTAQSQKALLPDGTRIEETGDMPDIALIRANTGADTRFDVVYAVYVPGKGKTHSYVVEQGVEGRPLEIVESDRKLALGYVTVRPNQSVIATDLTSLPIGLKKIGRFGETIKQVLFTTTENQTVINLDYDFLIGQNRVALTIGGVKQFFGKDYDETSTRQLTMRDPLPGGLAAEVLVSTSTKVFAEDYRVETLAAKQATLDAINAAKAAEEARRTAYTEQKAPVANFAAIATTYPAAVDGSEVQTLDDGKIYRKERGVWLYRRELTTIPYLNLEKKLDDQKYFLDIKEFGGKGDGVSDDTAAFEAMLATLQKGKTYLLSRGIYLVTRPLTFRDSHIEFDFNYSTFRWNGATPLGNASTRSTGMFNIKGVMREKIAITAFNLNQVSATEQKSTVTVVDATPFKEGSYAALSISNGVYSDTELRPKVDIIVRIIKVEGQVIHLSYLSPWRYPATGFTATLAPLSVIENIGFKNAFIEDIVPTTGTQNPNVVYGDRDHLVCGFSFECAVGCRISNIKAKNTKFPVVLSRYVYGMTIQDLELDTPAIVGGGEGYLVAASFCTEIHARRLTAVRARHLIDFTSSAYCSVSETSGYSCYSNVFQLHGYYEHDITYENCKGNWGNASGTDFGNANMNIFFNKHKGVMTGGGYCEGLRIEKSNLKLTRGYTDVTIKDSVVSIYALNDMEFVRRGEALLTRFIMENCKVTMDESKNTANLRGCDVFSITGKSELYFIGNNSDLSLGGKEWFLYDTKDVTVDGAWMDTLKFSLRGSARMARFTNNRGICRAAGFMFSHRDLVNTNLIVHLQNNRFEKNATFAVGAVNIPSTNNNTNTNVWATMTNNVSESCDWTVRNVGTGKVSLSNNTFISTTLTKDVLAVDSNIIM